MATQSGASFGSIITEDMNVSGSEMNWEIPISAVCCRVSSAIALENEPNAIAISTAPPIVTAKPATPPS